MKKILMMTSLVAMAFAAKADFLYWQIGDTTGVTGSYNSVAIWASTSADAVWSSGYTKLSPYYDADPDQTYITDVGNTTYENYYIELANYNTSTKTATTVGTLSGKWSDLSGAINASMTELQNVTVYTGSSYTNVPEPTSGLMLMLGLALMGLKRKRA